MKTKQLPTKKVASSKKNVVKKQTESKPTSTSTKKVNHIIPKIQGQEMILRFKKNIKNLNKVKFEMGKEFDKGLFEELLKLKGIKSVRIYNALNADYTHTFVITGLDAKSNEIYFKIKSDLSTKKSNARLIVQTTDEDGVGNMGNQCTEPPTFDKSAYFQKL